MRLIKIYRISDGSQRCENIPSKLRPPWFSKEKCFKNFVSVFGSDDLFVIADNVGDKTMVLLKRYVPIQRIIKTSYGSGAFSFIHAAKLATHFPDDTRILLSEDDWPTKQGALTILHEGLDIADYVTLGDFNDKYVNAGTQVDGCVGNPLISQNSEVTRVYLTKSCHWKETNSATMTFSTTAGIIRKDLPTYEKYCRTGFPYDFNMHRELIAAQGRKLISPLPGVATHCETPYLTKLTDWQRVLDETQNEPELETK